MDIGEKITLLRNKFSEGNNIKFAELMGETPATTSNWCKAKSLGREVLVKILSKLPDVDANWLLMNTGSMLKSEQFTSIKERLSHFLEEENISVPDFCKTIDMHQAYYVEMRGSIPESKLKNIMAKYPQLSIEWLMTGEGKMIKSADVQSEENEASTEIKVITKPRIPYTAAAGSLTEAVEGVTAEQCEQIPRINIFPEYDFTIIIKGNSMEPKYEGGDEVACKRIDSNSFIQWGKVHVLDTAQGILIKRTYEDGDKIRCVSYNPE